MSDYRVLGLIHAMEELEGAASWICEHGSPEDAQRVNELLEAARLPEDRDDGAALRAELREVAPQKVAEGAGPSLDGLLRFGHVPDEAAPDLATRIREALEATERAADELTARGTLADFLLERLYDTGDYERIKGVQPFHSATFGNIEATWSKSAGVLINGLPAGETGQRIRRPVGTYSVSLDTTESYEPPNESAIVRALQTTTVAFE